MRRPRFAKPVLASEQPRLKSLHLPPNSLLHLIHFVLLSWRRRQLLMPPQRIKHPIHPRNCVHAENDEFEARKEDVEGRFTVIPTTDPDQHQYTIQPRQVKVAVAYQGAEAIGNVCKAAATRIAYRHSACQYLWDLQHFPTGYSLPAPKAANSWRLR